MAGSSPVGPRETDIFRMRIMGLRSRSGSFMARFLGEDFLLSNSTARRLYHDYAVSEPILDYHCHLSPKDIAENRRFANLFEIWLEGDHYKWRALRDNGVPEKYITGDATPYEKFLAWISCVNLRGIRGTSIKDARFGQ